MGNQARAKDSPVAGCEYHNRGELETVLRYRSWQLFGTLTFRGEVPKSGQAVRLVFAHLYRCAGALSIPFHRLIWVLRSEHGEKGGRAHYHLLLGWTGLAQATLGQAFFFNYLWTKLPRCGYARHRLYDPEQHGAAYVVSCLTEADKSGANQYELGKFLLSGCDVMLSDSLVRAVADQRVHADRVRTNRECGKKRARRMPINRRWSGKSEWTERNAAFPYDEIDARLAIKPGLSVIPKGHPPQQG